MKEVLTTVCQPLSFLIVSIVFLFVVHVNGWLFQVPEDPYYAFLFAPIPLISTIASLVWLYTNHKGAGKGGYKIDVSEIQNVTE